MSKFINLFGKLAIDGNTRYTKLPRSVTCKLFWTNEILTYGAFTYPVTFNN